MTSLEQHLAAHAYYVDDDSFVACWCLQWRSSQIHDMSAHRAHVADAWREARTVQTVEELDALDPGTAIASHRGQRIYRKTRDRNGWAPAGNRDTEHAELIDLPAVILWTPEGGAL